MPFPLTPFVFARLGLFLKSSFLWGALPALKEDLGEDPSWLCLTMEPRVGDDEWPRWGFLLAGECRLVLGGDLPRAGGKRFPFMKAEGAGPVAAGREGGDVASV